VLAVKLYSSVAVNLVPPELLPAKATALELLDEVFVEARAVLAVAKVAGEAVQVDPLYSSFKFLVVSGGVVFPPKAKAEV